MHHGLGESLLERVFPEYVFARVPLLSERADRMPPRQLPDFISKNQPEGWDVRDGEPLPWILLSVSDCLNEADQLSTSDLELVRKVQFNYLDLANYDRSPSEMSPLRFMARVMVCGVDIGFERERLPFTNCSYQLGSPFSSLVPPPLSVRYVRSVVMLE